ncbi:hypothetical protein EMIT0P100_11001 [Pseudomonas sp. IT-P100]
MIRGLGISSIDQLQAGSRVPDGVCGHHQAQAARGHYESEFPRLLSGWKRAADAPLDGVSAWKR